MGRVWVEPFISLVTRFLDSYIVFISSQCNFLGVSAIIGTDDVDTSDVDVGLDGLTGLDSERGDRLATGAEYAYISSMAQ